MDLPSMETVASPSAHLPYERIASGCLTPMSESPTEVDCICQRHPNSPPLKCAFPPGLSPVDYNDSPKQQPSSPQRPTWLLSKLLSLNALTSRRNPLIRAFCGELVGTFLMLWWGYSAVYTAVIGDAMKGLWQVASTWGFAIAVSIYVSAPFSGAHLNPAFSIANALMYADFGWTKCAVYIVAQFMGSSAAAFLNLALWGPAIRRFEAANNIVRGSPESIRSAMIFGEYFPNPDIFKPHQGESLADTSTLITPMTAFFAEALGTAIIGIVSTALGDTQNTSIARGFEPFMLGFAIACNIVAIAPLTQAGFNPARDFSPRLAAWAGGWGTDIAFSYWWVYVFGPIVGAVAGVAVYECFFRKVDQDASTADGDERGAR
ncbi:aquaporin-like protein [Cladochytrium replicatum]|nr:aquaporin-like protein [Cladochytrium replicatum]